MIRYATALRSVNPTQRREAVKQLSRLGSGVPHAALASLVWLVDDPDDAIREGAAEVLVKAGCADPAALQVVLGTLAHAQRGEQRCSHEGGGARRPAGTAGRAAHSRARRCSARQEPDLLPNGGPGVGVHRPGSNPGSREAQRRCRLLCSPRGELVLAKVRGPATRSPADQTINLRRPSAATDSTVRMNITPDRPSSVQAFVRTRVLPREAPPSVDRRRAARHPIRRETFYCFLDDNDLWWQGEIRDVSTTGVGLLLSRRAVAGSWLTVDLGDAHEKLTRQAVAHVAHCRKSDDGWLVGCRFLCALSAEELHLLQSAD